MLTDTDLFRLISQNETFSDEIIFLIFGTVEDWRNFTFRLRLDQEELKGKDIGHINILIKRLGIEMLNEIAFYTIKAYWYSKLPDFVHNSHVFYFETPNTDIANQFQLQRATTVWDFLNNPHLNTIRRYLSTAETENTFEIFTGYIEDLKKICFYRPEMPVSLAFMCELFMC